MTPNEELDVKLRYKALAEYCAGNLSYDTLMLAISIANMLEAKRTGDNPINIAINRTAAGDIRQR